MAELIAEGVMGENHDFTWKFTNDGTLTISGSGVLKYSEFPSEWSEDLSSKAKFQRVVFEEGVTEIISKMQTNYSDDFLHPFVVEFPNSLYYVSGRIVKDMLIAFFHSFLPPKGDYHIISSKIKYVPFDAVETYKALSVSDVIMAMPPCFQNTDVVELEESNLLRVDTYKFNHVSVYTIDGALVLNKDVSGKGSFKDLIKKYGDYIAVVDGKQQRIKILTDYIEPEKKE